MSATPFGPNPRTRPSFPPSGLIEREARHRRSLLLIIAVLLLLATSPVLVHHLGSGIGTMLHGRDHLWVICLVALHELLEPVHVGFHALLIAGIIYAVVDRARAWRTVSRTLHVVSARRVDPASRLAAAATAAAVPADLIRVLDGSPMPAFTTGWWRPSIYVDASLAQQLSDAQLAAVLAHEHAHVIRRDPARLTLLRALGCLFFWLPALRRLSDDVADDAEVIADDFAARGNAVALASAILAMAQWRNVVSPSTTMVGFQRNAMLDRRIHRLLGDDWAITSRVTRPALLGAMLWLLLAWTSGLAVSHPMMEHSTHCDHSRMAAYEHLLCLVGHSRTHPGDCPHDGDHS
jgi:Zn-dependent protease with chaperone function